MEDDKDKPPSSNDDDDDSKKLKTDDNNPPDTNSDANPQHDEPSPTSPSTSAAAVDGTAAGEEGSKEAATDEKNEEDPQTTIEENEETAPPPPPDFQTVCEEIDQFVLSLNKTASERATPPENLNAVTQFAELIDEMIPTHDPSGEGKWNQISETDDLSCLDNADRLHRLLMSLREFSSETHYAEPINRVDGILQRAMSYLEDECRAILEDTKPPPLPPPPKEEQDPPSDQVSGDVHDQTAVTECEPVPEEDQFKGYLEDAVSNLHRICKAMTNAGYEAECSQLYIITRRNVLDESLHELGFEKFSIDDVQKMQWEALERGIASWTNTFKHFIKVQLPGERKQAETIFSSSDNDENNSSKFAIEIFTALSRAAMISLLTFAESVAMSKRSSEKLFKFLEVYETLRDTTAAFDEIFPEEYANELKTDVTLTRARLGESIVCIFCSLENSIKADTGKTPVPGGAIHPLTRYTMNYLKYACVYTETLEQVFREHQKIDRKDSACGSEYDCNPQQQHKQSQNPHIKLSPFATQLTKLMDLLDSNLETKSKLYRDIALSLIFQMNNGRYILQKIKGCVEIHGLLGDTWSRKRSSELRQYHKNYQRETWGKLLNCLSHEGLNVNGKVVKPVLKEKFKSFTTMFDEIHRTQSTWVVSDEQLQSELRVSITSVVIPAYRAFLARFGSILTPGRQTEKYVKYQPEDIETQIEELFDGNATAGGGKKR